MLIASSSTTLKFHEVDGATLLYNYQPNSRPEGPCRSISWSKDGNWLVVVPHVGFAEIITLKGQCKLLQTIKDVIEPCCAGFQNSTKRNIAIGTKHGQVLLYDVKSRSIKSRYPRASSAVTHVGFTAKDTHCYVGCSNGELCLYNNVAKILSCTLKVPKSNSLTSVQAHNQRRNFIVGGSNEGIVAVWDTNVNKTKFLYDAHKGPVSSTIFSPINAALVVSAGMDRQVCVFDVDDRERIACISVDNSITSLDFTEDGTHIAMGSQNGKIHVYDSRKLQAPIYSFEAHNSAVKHLAFQNSLTDAANCNSSVGSIPTDEVLKPVKSNEEIQSSKKRTSDFFDIIVEASPSDQDVFIDVEPPVATSMEAGDSFMRALGLDTNNTVDSMKNEISCHEESRSKILVENRRPSMRSFTPNPTHTIHERLGLYDSQSAKQATSTPKILPETFSPIISGNNQTKCQTAVSMVPITDMQNAIKEVVEEEVRKASDDLRGLVFNSAHQIRRMILDFHMAMVREFIKVENYFNGIKDEINPDRTINQSYLLEENINLRRKIEELESRIAGLSARSDNNGNNE